MESMDWIFIGFMALVLLVIGVAYWYAAWREKERIKNRWH